MAVNLLSLADSIGDYVSDHRRWLHPSDIEILAAADVVLRRLNDPAEFLDDPTYPSGGPTDG